MNKKIAFITLGCKVNLYDTEAMAELFTEKGYEVVDFEEYADVYLINTCTVTNLGDKKSRQMIRRAKRINPNSVVVATGCYAQVASEEVAKIEGINIVIGTKNRSEIVETVENYVDENGVVNNVSDIMGEKEFEPLQISRLTNRTRAYIKIQEGCNRYCTYCIIPYARGPIRSRKPEEVIEEVKKLAENGFKEVVLTGIHVASYGLDLGNITLADIIEKVHSVNGIERIRFSSMEPLAIDDDFVARMAKLPKVCDHYHLSLQSGCNRTLKRMNRKYNAEQYAEACERLRNAFPNVAITTDIIVGFPGETEEDFQETLDVVEKSDFDTAFTFIYSKRSGTPAAKMEDQVPEDVVKDRFDRLLKLVQEKGREVSSRFQGEVQEVLVETESKEKGIFTGRTQYNLLVHFPGTPDLLGKYVNVRLDTCKGFYYMGTRVED